MRGYARASVVVVGGGLRLHSRALGDGELVAGRYRVAGEIGRGGQGIVYRAHHVDSRQAVALKILATDADPTSRRRMEREARLMGALHHPNTVRLLDFGLTEDGEPFLAFEFVHGQTLEARLRALDAENDTMAADEAVAIAIQILRALQEAHAVGLIHRDLKPANVMLCNALDGELHVKLLDFGIACSTDPAFAQSGEGLGTPAYMSPEQCDAETVDARSDLYALGVILFRCLTGRLPFADGDVLALLRMHVLRPAPDVTSLCPSPISAALSHAVMRALAKQPEHRFASAREMCDVLTGRSHLFLSNIAQVLADQGPATQDARRPHHRPAWRVAILVAVLFCAVAMAGGGFAARQQPTASRRVLRVASAPNLPTQRGAIAEPRERASSGLPQELPICAAPAVAKSAPASPSRRPKRTSRMPQAARAVTVENAVVAPEQSARVQRPSEQPPTPSPLLMRQVVRMAVD